MKILVINGANMNLLGKREPDIYGREDYAALCARIYAHAQSRGIAVECFQSNHEGAIIDAIQEADGMFDGIVINPALTRTTATPSATPSRPSPFRWWRSTSPTLKSARSSAISPSPRRSASRRSAVTASRATPWASTCSRAQSSKSKIRGAVLRRGTAPFLQSGI